MRKEDNERLTRVGPGTPMGRLMREYWLPCLLSRELPSPDCPPVRVMLLCERLIAFRDTKGRIGLLDEACPHRRASLFFGRNADSGLRCAYHGWKFDVTGACVDIPTEPECTPLKARVRARAYPCVERGGVIWTYLGPRSVPPPLPEIEPNLDDRCGDVDAVMVESNWLQALEGDIDIPHLPFLHAENLERIAAVVRLPPSASRQNAAVSEQDSVEGMRDERLRRPYPPHIEVADTAAGFAFAAAVGEGAERSSNGKAGRTWSVGHFMFPFYANLPYGLLGSYWIVARVPMDDYHTMTFGFWRRGAPKPAADVMFGSEPAFMPNSSDWFGRFRLSRHLANDFRIDRDGAQFAGVGISGQAVQDAAITASMGPIVDRTREHLGTADIAIIHLRRMLLSALEGLEGGAPAVDNPKAYRVKQGTFQIFGDAAWHEELRRRGGAGRSFEPERAGAGN